MKERVVENKIKIHQSCESSDHRILFAVSLVKESRDSHELVTFKRESTGINNNHLENEITYTISATNLK